MRLLEYRQELFGRGYTVIGGDMHYEAMQEEKCQFIGMSRIQDGLPTGFVEDLIDLINFNWNENDGTESFHREKYAEILRGNKQEWKVIAFSVSVGSITFDLYNPKTNETDWFSLTGGDCCFRFEIPHSGNRANTQYDVTVCYAPNGEHEFTRVIEQIPHGRREIEFYNAISNNNKQYIEVTEYADL